MNSLPGENMRKARLSILVLLIMLLTGCVSFSNLVHDPAEDAFVRSSLHKATEDERNGDYLEALKHYRIALTIDSSNPDAAGGRNRVEIILKNSAEENYKRGLEAERQGRANRAALP